MRQCSKGRGKPPPHTMSDTDPKAKALKSTIVKIMGEWIRKEASGGMPVTEFEALEMYTLLEKTILTYQEEIQIFSRL